MPGGAPVKCDSCGHTLGLLFCTQEAAVAFQRGRDREQSVIHESEVFSGRREPGNSCNHDGAPGLNPMGTEPSFDGRSAGRRAKLCKERTKCICQVFPTSTCSRPALTH
jgi:hypothetical protein